LHNDFTLDVLDSETRSFGQQLRDFNDKTCPAFATRELPREYAARIRRNTKKPLATGRARSDQPPPRIVLAPGPQASNTQEIVAGNVILPPAITATYIRDPFIPFIPSTTFSSSAQLDAEMQLNNTRVVAGNTVVPPAITPTYIRDPFIPFIPSTAFSSSAQLDAEMRLPQVHLTPSAEAGITQSAPPASASAHRRTGGSSYPARLTNESRQLKTLNLNTYKIHALGDYVSAIRSYGTTDSYSTETVSVIVAVHPISL
jgi:hypothetical protein